MSNRTMVIAAKNNPEDTAERIAILTREIGMLEQVQPHLHGIPARHNRTRIADRKEQLATWLYVAELERRFGKDEIARCEKEASNG